MIEPAELAGLVPALRGLPADALARLARHAEERVVRPRSVIFRRGDADAALHFVLAGRVRVVQDQAGRPRVVHWEEPGGSLGEIPVFGEHPYPATATAPNGARLARLAGPAARRLATEDAALSAFFLSRIARRAAGLLDRLDDLRGATVTARLAEHLLARAAAAPDATFTLGMSQSALAEELGTVREVLVRSLATLRVSGAIDQPARGVLRVVDRARLVHMAED